VIIGVILGVAVLYVALSSGNEQPVYAYSELLADAAAGRVAAIEQDGTVLYVSLRDGRSLTSDVASESVNVYADVCYATGKPIGPNCSIYYAVVPGAGEWVGLLISALLPVLLIGAFFFFMMRQAQRADKPLLVKLADSPSADDTAE
jgi:ATP-dependent Zn protease